VPNTFTPTPDQPFHAQLTYWALPAAALAQRTCHIPMRTFETRLVTAHLIEATDRLHKLNGTRATVPECRQYVYPPNGADCYDPHAFTQLNTMRTQREVHATGGGSMPEVALHTRSEQCVLALSAPLRPEAKRLADMAAPLGRGTLSVLVRAMQASFARRNAPVCAFFAGMCTRLTRSPGVFSACHTRTPKTQWPERSPGMP
jgi:hypothetical protein